MAPIAVKSEVKKAPENVSNSSNTTLVAAKVKVATFASHPTQPTEVEDKHADEDMLNTSGTPASKMIESLVQKGKLKKDDDGLKVDKVDKKQEHKDDIREAFSGHIRVNSSKTAGPIPEKPKASEDPTPQSIEAKNAISGNLDKNGKNVLKLTDTKSNKTADKPVAKPAAKP